MSLHSLDKEPGRHKNPKIPLDQKNYNRCVLRETEDEFHFLIMSTVQ